ncbi:MAG TPA: RloB domain-containing protein [Candidatus Cloacimonetes bacterium]|nr:RloB domain-containing protein [Candidatus Cloacimonadota bacterium]
MPKKRSKKRLNRQKPFKRVIKIFCDGITERQYMDSIKPDLQNENIDWAIEPQMGLADRFEDVFDKIQSLLKSKAHQYILIFYIKDMDNIHAQNQFQAYKRAKEKCLSTQNASGRVFIIESRPCFEFWLLLHYKYLNRYFERCEPVINDLKTHLPNFKKKSPTPKQLYGELRDKHHTAICNAKRTTSDPSYPHSDQSYSEMHVLFSELSKKLPNLDLT